MSACIMHCLAAKPFPQCRKQPSNKWTFMYNGNHLLNEILNSTMLYNIINMKQIMINKLLYINANNNRNKCLTSQKHIIH